MSDPKPETFRKRLDKYVREEIVVGELVMMTNDEDRAFGIINDLWTFAVDEAVRLHEAELEQARKRIEELERDTMCLGSLPSVCHADESECITWYDGCRCTLATLKDWMQRFDEMAAAQPKAEREAADLKALVQTCAAIARGLPVEEERRTEAETVVYPLQQKLKALETRNEELESARDSKMADLRRQLDTQEMREADLRAEVERLREEKLRCQRTNGDWGSGPRCGKPHPCPDHHNEFSDIISAKNELMYAAIAESQDLREKLAALEAGRVPCRSCAGADTAKAIGAQCYNCRNKPHWELEGLRAKLEKAEKALRDIAALAQTTRETNAALNQIGFIASATLSPSSSPGETQEQEKSCPGCGAKVVCVCLNPGGRD